MKKIVFGILFAVGLFIYSPVFAQSKIPLYFFYGEGCPHCAKEELFLKNLEKENVNIDIKRYEVWHNQDNAKFLARLGKELDLEVKGVPILVIGDQTIVGYYDDEITGAKIKNILVDYTINGCNDIVAPLLNNNACVNGCDPNDAECLKNCGCTADNIKDKKQNLPDKINLPFIGEINLKTVSIPLLTVLIGITDGFNPCAMWILLFLISLLIGMKDKGRMWTLGSAFIIASGFVYFLFLAAWLNLFLFLGFVLWVRAAIAIVALGTGGYQLYDFYKNRTVTCVIEKNDKRKKIFDRLREITSNKQFLLALFGIIVLAFAVNLVELVCSAGLPAVYTQVLALANLPKWQYYGYLFLYIFFFMLDDILVYLIAMKTFEIKVSTAKYGKYSGLIGGAIMVAIGILLLFKPGWLMFG